MSAQQRINELLAIVAQQGASDLHLVVGSYPMIRVDGRLLPLSQDSILTADDTKSIVDALLTDVQQQTLADTGSVDFSYNYEDKARFRTNVFFQKGRLSVAMRLIPAKIRSLAELNVPEKLYDFAERSQGLVLMTGPVGHGKSTTLAALVDAINASRAAHILTIEDPIEYIHTHNKAIINQREIGQDARSFADALRAALREDVNVILVGEMRDLETIQTVMTAAETGHLIFATLHTNDAAQTVDRIVDVFPSHQQNQIRAQLANVLLGVVSQRLLPRIGGGRIPAVEIMIKNHAIENLIRENKSYQIDTVIETSLQDGMISLDKSLADLASRGIVTQEDALMYAKNREYFTMLMRDAAQQQQQQ